MADRIDEELLAACPELRVVAAVAKGHDNIDLRACTDRGVWVTNLPDLLTGPTAELAVGLTLALLRRITEADTSIRSDGFTGWRPDFYATSLQGSTVGILGMGRLGHALARRVAAFDAQVLYHDPHPLIPTLAAKHGTRAASLEELLAGSDIVVPLLPLTPETQGLLDAKALAMMRPGAFLVNVGRGSVVDEHAVADALETGRLGGYAADVFACEDLGRPDRPERIPPRLLASPRTVFTSHLGSAVDKVRRDMGLAAVGQVQQALAGERPEYALNEVIG
jgi:phosphonate dehydrogenase